MYRYNNDDSNSRSSNSNRRSSRVSRRVRSERVERDEWMPTRTTRISRSRRVRAEAKLDLSGIENDLDKLLGGWGDIKMDDLSDAEQKDIKKFDDALKDVQRVMKSHRIRARRAKQSRQARRSER